MSNKFNMVIYRDVPVKIIHKCWHIHKIGKKEHRNFTADYGDIPTATYNDITKKFEEVINTRGFAYAKRNHFKYHKKKKPKIEEE